MQVKTSLPKKSKGYITNSVIVLIALATAFFPRVLLMVKAPPPINFVHFAVVPLACGLVLSTTRAKNYRQIILAQKILLGIFILFTIEVASAFFNSAGAINVILSFLLLGEPFLLILAIVTISMSPTGVERLRAWVMGFGFINLLFALVQKFIWKWDTCGCSPGGWGDGDAIKGVFIAQGSGHVVSASISVSLATYYFVTAKKQSIWLRFLVVFASFVHLVVADAKQVIITLVVGFAILSLSKLKDIQKLFLNVTGTIIFILGFFWAIQNIEALSSFNTWIRPEIYGPDGEATQLKIVGIRIIISHFQSPIHWLLGLGPGHTIDRLGGWMLKDYSHLLSPLGATTSSVGIDVWRATGKSWLGDQSSMFSPFFSWAGIWGDIGFFGLGAYLYLGSIIWRSCDDLSKFLMLTVLVHGFIFTQMQEPGYMLFIAFLLGLRWQEIQRDNQLRKVKRNYHNASILK